MYSLQKIEMNRSTWSFYPIPAVPPRLRLSIRSRRRSRS